MISRLIKAEVEREDGTKTALDDVEITSFISLLGGAGAETVTKLMGSAVVLFARHPDQWQLLQSNPDLIPSAIEEILRYEPPASYIARYVMKDFTAHGVTIPAGSAALLAIGSATRDESAYEDPERFDITRPSRLNLGFGYGVHSCLGAALARMESRVALERLMRIMPRYEIDEAGLRRVNMANVLGYANVPVKVLP
jgi:cytochrome P450